MESYFTLKHSKRRWLVCLCAGSAIFLAVSFAVLFSTLGRVRGMVVNTSVDAQLGPLALWHIHKGAGASGSQFVLDISTRSGLLVLLLVVAVLIVLAGWWLGRRQAKPSSD